VGVGQAPEGTTSPDEGSGALQATILALVDARSPGASICPSEAARAAAGSEDPWRALMAPVREAAAALADRGELEVTQGGVPVDPRAARGPIRLRRPGLR